MFFFKKVFHYLSNSIEKSKGFMLFEINGQYAKEAEIETVPICILLWLQDVSKLIDLRMEFNPIETVWLTDLLFNTDELEMQIRSINLYVNTTTWVKVDQSNDSVTIYVTRASLCNLFSTSIRTNNNYIPELKLKRYSY